MVTLGFRKGKQVKNLGVLVAIGLMSVGMVSQADSRGLYGRDNPLERTRGSDGWNFGTPEFERTEFQVRMVYHQSVRELEESYNSLRTTHNIETGGLDRTFSFAILRRDEVCEIHVLHPSRMWRPEFSGHELMHCSFGRWHR